jgi:dihydroneopterin aldolase
MYVLSLEEVQFYGYHGVTDHERKLGHHYSMDLHLRLEGAAPESDSLVDGVDYADLAASALKVASRPCHTIERLARVIAEDVLERYSQAVAVTVRVRKLQPPMASPTRAACVELTLTRSGLPQ